MHPTKNVSIGIDPYPYKHDNSSLSVVSIVFSKVSPDPARRRLKRWQIICRRHGRLFFFGGALTNHVCLGLVSNTDESQ
jgi:hypothetical protein